MHEIVRFLFAFAVVGLLLLAGCPATLPADYEPNDSLADSFDLGTIEEGMPERAWNATIAPSGDFDFFGLTAVDSSSIGIPGNSETFALAVRLLPPEGTNYDLHLYDGSGTLLDSSTNTGAAEDTIQLVWPGTYGLDDSKDFRIEVRGAGGAASATPYTLFADLEETSP
jgi:hypothetical protein